MEILLALAVSLSVLALLVAVYTLLVHVRFPDLAQLKQRIAALDIAVDTIHDSMEHAQRRNAARQRRDNATTKAEGAATAATADLRHTPMTKEQLRVIARGR